MKRICLKCAILVIALFTAGLPGQAAENETAAAQDQQTQQKDECLLVARKCGTSVISIQDKIERLKEEIAKGRAVYTVEELNFLQQKLNEVSKTLDFLLEK